MSASTPMTTIHSLSSDSFRLVKKTAYCWLVVSGSTTIATIEQHYNWSHYEERSWRMLINIEGAKSTKHFNPDTAFEWLKKNWNPVHV